MKATFTCNELGTRGKEALETVLHQLSTIEVKGIEDIKSPDLSRPTEFAALIRVLGRNYSLTCKVSSSGELRAVRKALREFQEDAARVAGSTIPVIIAPYLSPEARALCVEHKAGFVDFEDNARLLVGEVFIGKRSAARREGRMLAPAQAIAAKKFPPLRAAAPASEWELAAAVPA